MAKDKSKRDVSFYTKKITSYFQQMEEVNLFTIADTTFRHGVIKNQLSLIDGIQGILPSINSYLKRNKKNYYFLLEKFEERVNELRKYVEEYDTRDLESTYKPDEDNLQFTMMSRISRYEDFIQRELDYEPPKEETDDIEIQGNATLSLADRKLI